VNRKELWTLVPLALLSLVVGIYPKIVIDYFEPTMQRILAPFL
jgi:NADH:ubiquinone oxidoreductase subunit 4 (subunit M)